MCSGIVVGIITSHVHVKTKAKQHKHSLFLKGVCIITVCAVSDLILFDDCDVSLFKWLPLQMVVHSLYQCWGNSCTKTSCLQCTVHQVNVLTVLSSTGNKVVWSRIWWGFCHISVLVWKSKCLTLTCIQWPKITAYCTSLKLPQYSGGMYCSHTVIIPKPCFVQEKKFCLNRLIHKSKLWWQNPRYTPKKNNFISIRISRVAYRMLVSPKTYIKTNHKV